MDRRDPAFGQIKHGHDEAAGIVHGFFPEREVGWQRRKHAAHNLAVIEMHIGAELAAQALHFMVFGKAIHVQPGKAPVSCRPDDPAEKLGADTAVLIFPLDRERDLGTSEPRIADLAHLSRRMHLAIREKAIDKALRLAEAERIVLNEVLADRHAESHPPVLVIEPLEVVAELIAFCRPQSSDRSSPDTRFRHRTPFLVNSKLELGSFCTDRCYTHTIKQKTCQRSLHGGAKLLILALSGSGLFPSAAAVGAVGRRWQRGRLLSQRHLWRDALEIEALELERPWPNGRCAISSGWVDSVALDSALCIQQYHQLTPRFFHGARPFFGRRAAAD